jgi:hypothetical protein
MKVPELIAELEKLPAGAEVVICKYNSRTEDFDYFDIDGVSGGEVETDGTISNAYLDMGAKQ